MKTRKNRLKPKIQIFDVVNYTLLTIFSLIAIYPMYYVFIGALSNGDSYAAGGVWLLPKNITFSNFIVIFYDEMLWYAFRNTILKTIFGTGLSLIFTSIVAYAMSRKELRFRKTIRFISIFTMFFSGGLIPYFVLVNYLGLYDNFLVYIIPSLYSVYNMIILSNFFSSISNELHESAEMDGASEFYIYRKIYMPLAKPALATVALWTSVGHWNSYFSTMIYSNAGKDMITLQYYLMGVINQARYNMGEHLNPGIIEEVTSTTVSYAAIIIATIPILLIYPFLQKYFTFGLQEGATKG
jgi:putative aldouronate transport system permease protein